MQASKPKAPDLSGMDIPRAKKGEAAPATPAAQLNLLTPPAEEPRTTVSTRLTITLQERLRRYAYEARRDKQGIIEEALAEYLKSKGF